MTSVSEEGEYDLLPCPNCNGVGLISELRGPIRRANKNAVEIVLDVLDNLKVGKHGKK